MIDAQSSFIPLFFDEAETDLWLALQRIEPEERSSFIKASLRQVLLGENASSIDDKVIPADSSEEELKELKEESKSTESFSLEALFEVNVLDQDTEQVVEFDQESLREDKPIRSAGFEYMMKHIIGTEEDEAVLEVLRGFLSKKGQ
ncbi:MAG: hypothetical protein APF81_21405 [Desulfosporosinus sp. BRH_c37]|nr:MAG: hypothetical protein APF81_21405 [Desulfosporosinus sp. BRH_c37]